MTEQLLPIPHLPSGQVTCVLASDVKQPVIRALQSSHIRVLATEPLYGVSGAECCHADMAVCHLHGAVWWTAKQLSATVKELLQQEGCLLTETQQPVTAECPSLNICILDGKVFACPKTTDPLLLTTLQSSGKRCLTVRQRYTKCSMAVVSAHAVITADTTIEKACCHTGIDVLKISPGHIALDGYAYGFIGGCCGLLSPDCLAFSGRIEQHPDYQAMKAFARNHGVSLLSLTDDPLYDIGGILPVKQTVTEA